MQPEPVLRSRRSPRSTIHSVQKTTARYLYYSTFYSKAQGDKKEYFVKPGELCVKLSPGFMCIFDKISKKKPVPYILRPLTLNTFMKQRVNKYSAWDLVSPLRRLKVQRVF